MTVSSQRPGVYSSYDVTSAFRASSGTRYAAIVSQNLIGAPDNVYTIETLAAARQVFGDSSELAQAAAILFKNGAAKVYAVALANTGASNFSDAFKLLLDIPDIGAVVCESSETGVLSALKAHLDECALRQRERLGFCGADVPAQALSAASINSERIVICTPATAPQEGVALRGLYTAAALAGMVLAQPDPSYNFNGAQMTGITVVSGKTGEDEINQLIDAGVTVLEDVYGVVECIRAVTTRTLTEGVADRSFKSVNTVLIIDHVIKTIRDVLKIRLKGAKNNSFTLKSISSQVVVELSGLMDEGIINGYDAPSVYTHSGDPSVCVVELSFKVAHVVNQIHVISHIQI